MTKKRNSLKNEGWIPEFVADEALARDAKEIYGLMGFDVFLCPLGQTHPKKEDDLSLKEFNPQFLMVYIRPKKSFDDEEEWT